MWDILKVPYEPHDETGCNKSENLAGTPTYAFFRVALLVSAVQCSSLKTTSEVNQFYECFSRDYPQYPCPKELPRLICFYINVIFFVPKSITELHCSEYKQ